MFKPFSIMILVACLLCPAARAAAWEPGVDRPGLDFRDFDLMRSDPQLCRLACLKDTRCRAFTYVKPGIQGPRARCWLKEAVPPPVKNQCCVSGVIRPQPGGKARVPAPPAHRAPPAKTRVSAPPAHRAPPADTRVPAPPADDEQPARHRAPPAQNLQGEPYRHRAPAPPSGN